MKKTWKRFRIWRLKYLARYNYKLKVSTNNWYNSQLVKMEKRRAKLQAKFEKRHKKIMLKLKKYGVMT